MITSDSERSENLRHFVASPLFQNFSMADLDSVYDQMDVQRCEYKRGEVLYGIGEKVDRIGLITSGSVFGYSGADTDRHIIIMRYPGSYIGLAPFLSDYDISNVVMETVKNTELLRFDIHPLLESEEFGLRIRDTAMQLLTRSSADDIVRMNLLLLPSIRERVLMFFSIMQRQTHEQTFQLKFNQSGFADYLGINRSALNRELNKMQKEGILELLPKQQYRLLKKN